MKTEKIFAMNIFVKFGGYFGDHIVKNGSYLKLKSSINFDLQENGL